MRALNVICSPDAGKLDEGEQCDTGFGIIDS